MSARVVVTRPVVGICHMQVCAVAEASDEEVLEVANRENPAGTGLGWARVIRTGEGDEIVGTGFAPVPCASDSTRLHLMVSC